MRGILTAGVWLAAAALLAGCDPQTVKTDQDVARFRQERAETALQVQVDTLQAKLDEAREQLAQAGARYDMLQAELVRVQNLRRNEQKLVEDAARWNDELKKKLDDVQQRYEIEHAASETLRQDVIRLRQQVERLEQENKALRDKLAAGPGRVAPGAQARRGGT